MQTIVRACRLAVMVLVGAVLVVGPTRGQAAAPGPPGCEGDCDGDGGVSASDLVLAVRVALGEELPTACVAADANGNGRVSVDELLRAIRRALNGCVAPDWSFTDVTAEAGFAYRHRYLGYKKQPSVAMMMGGVAAGDYDGDGWVDLYTVGGESELSHLFRNRGDGTFADMPDNVPPLAESGCGPTFADVDGDGWLDLFIGGVQGTSSRFLRNRGDGSFDDVTSTSGVALVYNTFSAAFGDYDRDGDLDMALAHWDAQPEPDSTIEHLWRNDGAGNFSPVSVQAGLGDLTTRQHFTFTPNFADINSDGWPDLLFASDFKTSSIFLNRNGHFANATTDVISDENGMGAAVGDYDNDGDLDWFVSSIWDPNQITEPMGGWDISGNRLYRNRGDGTFEDVTDATGIRQGDWGWGSCFADFNNDGRLDIFQVNGFGRLDFFGAGFFLDIAAEFHHDRSRLFIANDDGTFSERSAVLGLNDDGQGRGIVCFDYDGDGDVDIFIANNGQPPRLYRNDGGNRLNYLAVKLRGVAPNTQGIGARVYASAGGQEQMREIRAGSNFASQNPTEVHFGLGEATTVSELRVVWPGGETTTLKDIAVNQRLVVDEAP